MIDLPNPDTDLPEATSEEHERRVAYFGGEIELQIHDLDVAAARLRAASGHAPRRLQQDPPTPRRVHPLAAALTKREAARRLGIDRSTLEALIRRKIIKVVPWTGQTGGSVGEGARVRVPRSEVERLAEEGIRSTPPQIPRRAAVTKARKGDVAEAIRSLKI